jgi:NAD(P)-dependent dehydrogenase (short-subunit alcohol dehydrogenase family)
LRRLDGIVHCASEFELPSPLGLQSADQWQRLYKVNVIAPAAINRTCQPLLQVAPSATVILIGESHGHTPCAYWGGFAVSKAALEAYFRIQSEEWAGLPNLGLHLVIPGPINSPQRAKSHPGEDKSTLPDPADLAAHLADLMNQTGAGQLLEWQPE